MDNETKSKIFAYSATSPVVGYLFGLLMGDLKPSFPQGFFLCGFLALSICFFCFKIDRLLAKQS